MKAKRRPRNKNLSIIVAIIASTTATIPLLTGCNRIQQNQTTGELQKVTIAQFGDFFLYAPLYVAIDAGLFEKNGLVFCLLINDGLFRYN